ncbi:hypothetical protein HPB48_018060 [Haemaphysalis longicornis]|uniref:Tick transposon n=1 Tax=Haemaphysalis longicornis TaxID=44386 RepID=A0A9J6GKG6_HAELO|nr:hypothetical protein HPB48_018060 [Haemaphysalis longicornis]
MGRSPMLLLQVTLQLAFSSCPFVSWPAISTERQLCLHQTCFGPPGLEEKEHIIWQQATSSTAICAPASPYKRQPDRSSLGHDIASRMGRSPMLLLQVSYLSSSAGVKTSNYCLLAVSCPPDLCETVKRYLSVPSRICDSVINMLLLCSGDVELNPGPNDKILAAILESVRGLEAGQETILTELKGVKEKQAETDAQIKQLNDRVASLEASIASRSPGEISLPENSLQGINDQLQHITSRCDSAENRMRRSNLLFFGIEDDVNEDWEASEKKLIEFCEENLQITLTSQQFERVHRLGRFSPDKCRPIIAKFVLFKDKQIVQASTKKLKDTDYSISQDFSVATREARKKLIEFAKPSKQAFKLRVDRLEMNGKTYVYDSSTKSVVRSQR